MSNYWNNLIRDEKLTIEFVEENSDKFNHILLWIYQGIKKDFRLEDCFFYFNENELQKVLEYFESMTNWGDRTTFISNILCRNDISFSYMNKLDDLSFVEVYRGKNIFEFKSYMKIFSRIDKVSENNSLIVRTSEIWGMVLKSNVEYFPEFIEKFYHRIDLKELLVIVREIRLEFIQKQNEYDIDDINKGIKYHKFHSLDQRLVKTLKFLYKLHNDGLLPEFNSFQ